MNFKNEDEYNKWKKEWEKTGKVPPEIPKKSKFIYKPLFNSLFQLSGILILINYLTIRSQARKDYKLSRGTQHLKQIRTSIKVLNKKIQTLVPKLKENKVQFRKIIETLNSVEEIRKKALTEENKLNKVTISHFIKARRNNKDASLLVNEYIKGAFPEWSPMPTWYKILVAEYGD